jgi:hypothetical protein
MEMRGARKRGRIETVLWRGAFADDPILRGEFLAAARRRGGRDRGSEDER